MNTIAEFIRLIEKQNEYEAYFELWANGLSDEIRFWVNAFYMDAEWWEKWLGYSPYQYEYDFKYTDYFDGDSVKILDVGSGPVSDCGSKADRLKVDIEAVDPLAYIYEKIKKSMGLSTKITINYSNVESLSDIYNFQSCALCGITPLCAQGPDAMLQKHDD